MIYEEFEAQYRAITMPGLQNIKDVFFKDFDIFVGTKQQINSEEVRLTELAADEIQNVRREYAVKTNAIFNAFKQALADEYGTNNKEINDIIYSRAYLEGNDSGMEGIEDEYKSIAETINDVIHELKTKVNLDGAV